MTEEKSETEVRAKLEELLGEMSAGILVTRHKDGSMHGRPMAVERQLEDGELWFLTDVGSEKVADIEAVDDVAVAFADPDRDHFVSVSGKASIVRDRDLLRAHWLEAERPWFPDGPDDANLVAIRVAITHAEYWDAHTRRLPLAADYAKEALTGVPSDSEAETGSITFR